MGDGKEKEWKWGIFKYKKALGFISLSFVDAKWTKFVANVVNALNKALQKSFYCQKGPNFHIHFNFNFIPSHHILCWNLAPLYDVTLFSLVLYL